MSNRWLCLLFAMVLLVFSCKGTPDAKDSETDLPEPVLVIPENDESKSEQEIDEAEANADSSQDNLAEQDLSAEYPEPELTVEDSSAIEDSLAVQDSEEPKSELETTDLTAAPLEAPTQPEELPVQPAEVANTQTAVPTEPVSPQITAGSGADDVTESEGTEEEVAQEPSAIVRWPPPRLPVLEPPALRPQLIPDEEPIFSRVVRVTVGQLLEIPFRGTGWVYLGEMDSRRGISYGSRRVEPEGQNFVFRVEAAGTYALKFYKQDFIRDIIFNDYVQVIAEESLETATAPWFNPPSGGNRVVAEPRWPSTLEEAEIARNGGRRSSSPPEVSVTGTRPSASGTPTSGTAGSAPPTSGVSTESPSAASGTSSESPPPASGALTSGTSSPSASSLDRATPPTNGTVRTPPANTATTTPPPPQQDIARPALPAITDEGIVPVRPPAISGSAENAKDGADTDWPPEVFLQKAQEEFDAGKIAEAIALLNRMRELYPIGNDELYWLLGQFYEANSPSRDILTSLDYYRRLIKEFPQSRRYNDARRRIAYLERYYINIQ